MTRRTPGRFGGLPWLAAGAFLASLFIASIPNAPATAVILEDEVYATSAAVQTYTAPPIAAPAAGRDPYTVTIVTVVQWPSADRDVTSDGDFGPRSCRGCSYMHKGDDFNPGGGTPVEAVADGTVIFAGWGGALGEAVFVAHTINGVPTVTKYAHMAAGSINVSYGQEIKRSQTLGLVGNTGLSTGNHLHFQVEIGGTPIDPMPWLLGNANADQWAGLG